MAVYSNKLVVNVLNKPFVNASNCSTPGTLTFNGKTYCMQWRYLPQHFIINQIGTGTLVVYQLNSSFNGTYDNTPVYLYNNYLYVWPNGRFSMISTTPYS